MKLIPRIAAILVISSDLQALLSALAQQITLFLANALGKTGPDRL